MPTQISLVRPSLEPRRQGGTRAFDTPKLDVATLSKIEKYRKVTSLPSGNHT